MEKTHSLLQAHFGVHPPSLALFATKKIHDSRVIPEPGEPDNTEEYNEIIGVPISHASFKLESDVIDLLESLEIDEINGNDELFDSKISNMVIDMIFASDNFYIISRCLRHLKRAIVSYIENKSIELNTTLAKTRDKMELPFSYAYGAYVMDKIKYLKLEKWIRKDVRVIDHLCDPNNLWIDFSPGFYNYKPLYYNTTYRRVMIRAGYQAIMYYRHILMPSEEETAAAEIQARQDRQRDDLYKFEITTVIYMLQNDLLQEFKEAYQSDDESRWYLDFVLNQNFAKCTANGATTYSAPQQLLVSIYAYLKRGSANHLEENRTNHLAAYMYTLENVKNYVAQVEGAFSELALRRIR